jgi:NAD(P)H-hydrate epimerase
MSLPKLLYRAADVREFDRRAGADHGLSSDVLMRRAGEFAFRALADAWPSAHSMRVFCGGGNNGGDGYVVAERALAAGFEVEVVELGDPERIKGAAANARQRWIDMGGRSQPLSGELAGQPDVIVDALMGTGLSRPLEGRLRKAVEAINANRAPVLAIDIPSGLGADTGAKLGAAVRAEVTITFIGMKCGLLTGQGPEFCGKLVFNDLGVPGAVYAGIDPAATLLMPDEVAAALPRRGAAAHKGKFGHVLVVGGDLGKGGAVRLMAEAALRAGAGLVSAATRPEHVTVVLAGLPEAMCLGVSEADQIADLLERVSVVAVGPGLGQAAWGRQLLARVLDTDLPLIADADALNLIAAAPTARGNWIITPHPGEAGRLLDRATGAVQADRFTAVAELARRYDAVAVLKGAGSLVLGKDGPVGLCAAGNAGMAAPGMGDALTGVIAALVAQGLSHEQAARVGVLAHAQAGDLAAQNGPRGMRATDLMDCLRIVVNPPVSISSKT